MKNLLLLLVLVVSATSFSQVVNIPDPLFKEYLVNSPGINTNGDTEIQVSEAEAVESLSIWDEEFNSIQGIEAFVNLTSFTFQLGSLPSADLSNNNLLDYIFITSSGFQNIILPNNTTLLTRLTIQGSEIEDLNEVSNYTNIEYLTLLSDSLETINITGLINLKELRIGGSILNELDVSQNTNLETLSIGTSQLTSLDLSANDLLEFTLGSLNDRQTDPIASIDLSEQTNLTKLELGNTMITAVDLSNNLNLRELVLRYSSLLTLDVSNNIQLETLEIRDGDLVTLDLEANAFLKEVDIEALLLETITFSTNAQLEILSLYSMVSLQSLDLSSCTQLIELELSGIRLIGQSNTVLENLDLSQNTLLAYAQIEYFTGLNSLVLEGANSLETLIVRNLSIPSLDVNTNAGLRGLYVGGMNTPIDISELSNLDYLTLRNLPEVDVLYPTENTIKAMTFDGTGYTALDFNGFSSLCWLRLSNNLYLEHVNISNIDLSSMASSGTCITDPLYVYGTFESDLRVNNNPNLRFICVDNASFAAANFNDTVDGYVTFTEDCSLNADDLNTITGAARFDLNGNSCASGASAIPNRLVLAQGEDFLLGTATNELGNYQLNVGEGVYTTYLPDFPNIYTVNPEEATNTFVGFGNTENEDFCVQAAQTVNDLTVAIGANNQPTLEGTASYSIVYENAGTTPQNSVITYTYNDTKLNFVEAIPEPTSQTSGSITWNLGIVNPVVAGDIFVRFGVSGSPVNEVGDALVFTASIEPVTGDATPGDNTFSITDFIEAAPFAPLFNGSQPDQILIEEADEYLYFSVGFENFTPQDVENAVVYFSTASFTNINMETVQLMAASHPVNLVYAEGVFYFYMNDINLAPLLNSGGEAQGYLTFRFKPVNTIQAGDRVQFQPQVSLDGHLINAFTSVEYVTELGVEENIQEVTKITLFPNPTTGILNISATENIQRINVYAMTGQLLKTKSNLQQTDVTMSIEELASGIYFARVKTDSREKIFRVVKK